MTINEFKEHVAMRVLEPGKRPVIDWCGRDWHVVGMPDAEYARGRFVTIRHCVRGGSDKLMPVAVAHTLLPEGLTVADVS